MKFVLTCFDYDVYLVCHSALHGCTVPSGSSCDSPKWSRHLGESLHPEDASLFCRQFAQDQHTSHKSRNQKMITSRSVGCIDMRTIIDLVPLHSPQHPLRCPGTHEAFVWELTYLHPNLFLAIFHQKHDQTKELIAFETHSHILKTHLSLNLVDQIH